MQAAIEGAFNAWTAIDPGTGLGTQLQFVPDFLVVPTLGDNTTGAEIDLFGENVGSGFQGLAMISAEGPANMTLTSGTVINNTLVFNGSQIQLNTNQVQWTLDILQRTLTHEIGHTLGLDDVETAGIRGAFIDDNFAATDAETIQATLTNSFSALIDPLAPERSVSISKYAVDRLLFDIAGPNSFAPHLLMESAGDPDATFELGLDADSFAGRQYLYPSVPRSGDFDGNGVLEVSDVESLMTQIRQGDMNVRFDVNIDHVIDHNDLTVWVRTLKKTYFGDANLDGLFNSSDLVSVLSTGEYEDEIPANSGWTSGDWNADAEFTSGDLVSALADGGYELVAVTVAVPEPASGLGFFAAVLILGLRSFFAASSHCGEPDSRLSKCPTQ
jgi:hypothetical protein